MKSIKLSPVIIVIAVVILLIAILVPGYNGLVEKKQTTDRAWAEVQNQYQRRSDLIPNLVNAVKGYTKHESSTLEAVTEARAKAGSINISADNLTPENLAKFQQAQDQLSGALKSLLAVSEAYPDLKASQNFMDLQTQLEGTENRVATARSRYTEAVQNYNTAIKRFPAVIYASWFGFTERPQFTATDEAQTAPKVEF